MPKDNLNHYRQELQTIVKSHACTQVGFDEASRRDYPLMIDALVELHKQSVLELLPKPIDNYTGTDMEDWQKGYNQLRQEIRERLS